MVPLTGATDNVVEDTIDDVEERIEVVSRGCNAPVVESSTTCDEEVVGNIVVVVIKPGGLLEDDDIIGSVTFSIDIEVVLATGVDVVDDATKLVVLDEVGEAVVVVTTSSTMVLTCVAVSDLEVVLLFSVAALVELELVITPEFEEVSLGNTRLVVTKIAGLVDSNSKETQL